MAEWDLQAGTLTLLVALVLAGATLWFSIQHLRAAVAGRRVWLMEALRLLCLVMVVVTLLRPERIQERVREERPNVVILWDGTGSMVTQDLLLPQQAAPVTRADWLASQLTGRFWAPLEERYQINIERFGTGSPALDLSAPEVPAPEPAPPPAPEPDATAANADATADTDLSGSLQSVLHRYPHPRAVVLLSDGDWNQGGSPVAAATQMRLRQARIYPVVVGSDQWLPDLALEEVKAPAFSLVNEFVALPFRIQSRLPRELRTRIRLLGPNGVEAEKEITIPAQGRLQDNLLWQPTILGDAEMRLELPLETDEKLTDNNTLVFRISIRREQLKVLVVESMPRWEYRYLRNALSRDPGVDVHCLLLHPGLRRGDGVDYIQRFPASREEIGKYDVIFLGDVGLGEGELREDELALIRGLVEQQGSGLVFLPGARGRQLSLLGGPLDELLPVTLDESKPRGIGFSRESRLALTSAGEDHLLTMLARTPGANRLLWQGLPGFFWNAAVLKARPGAEVLAVHGALRNQHGRMPLLVTRSFGNGNVLFMGTDAAWRWRKGVEDTYHYRFWGQVVRWMAHRRHLAHDEGVRLFFTPENPRQGETVMLQATILDDSGFPVSAPGVAVELSGPNQSERLTLAPVPGGWGVYSGQFTPRQAGAYGLKLHSPEANRRLETKLHVAGVTLEKIGQPARLGPLQDLARITEGRLIRHDELAALVQDLQLLPEPRPEQQRYQLWCQWWWGLLLVSLLGAFWIVRKLSGQI